MVFRVLAAGVALVHAAYLAYVALGGLLAWRRPYAAWPHAAAVGWAAAIVVYDGQCPLTWLENAARQRAGMPVLPPGGFIGHYVEGVLYPAGHDAVAQAAVAVLVTGSWAGAYHHHRRGPRSRPPGSRTPAPAAPSWTAGRPAPGRPGRVPPTLRRPARR